MRIKRKQLSKDDIEHGVAIAKVLFVFMSIVAITQLTLS